MESFLIWLSGARQEVLAVCETDRPKYTGIGSAVLVTATMAGVSMTFALHSALKAALPLAVAFAFAWALAIMSLDRWLVVSLVRQRKKLNYLLLALPRVALAVLFGLIISTPFTLQIFAPEINRQIALIQQQDAEAFHKKQSTSTLTKTIANEQAEINKDKEIIGTSGSAYLVKDSVLAGDLATAERQKTTDYNAWLCQLYGEPGCPAGDGVLAAADEQAYRADLQTIASLNRQIAARTQSGESANVSSASEDLAAVTPSLAGNQREQAMLEESFKSTNASDAGLLLRLRALDAYSAGSSTLEAARWVLFLFFTAIECLPILVKVLLNLGPESLYEKAIARADKESLDLVEKLLPQIVAQTAEARLRGVPVKRSRHGYWETATVSHNGWTSPNGVRQVDHPPYRPPAL